MTERPNQTQATTDGPARTYDGPGASSAVRGINPRITAQISYSIDSSIPGEWHLRIIRSSIPAG